MPIVKDITVNQDGKDTIFYIEVDKLPAEQRSYETRGSVEDALKKTQGIFTSAMDLIHDCAGQVAQTLNTLSQEASPSELEVQLSMKFDASIGVAVIAQTSAETQLQVTMKWIKTSKP